MLTGPEVILVLKVAVCAVTLLLLTALIAVARGNYWLHGRINMVFFVLTVTALFGLELVARVIDPALFDYFDERTRRILAIHLCSDLRDDLAVIPALRNTGPILRVPLPIAACARGFRRWATAIRAVFQMAMPKASRA